MCKNSLHFKALHPWTTILKQKTICLFPCKHWARLLRNLGITSTEHTFTKGTWFSSDMPVSFLSVAHTINIVHTNLVLINTVTLFLRVEISCAWKTNCKWHFSGLSWLHMRRPPLCYLVSNIIMNTQCIRNFPEAAGREGSAVRLNILVMQCYLI